MGPFSSIKYTVLWHSQSTGDVKQLPTARHHSSAHVIGQPPGTPPLVWLACAALQLCRVPSPVFTLIHPESLSPLCGNKNFISCQLSACNLWPCSSIPGGPSGVPVLSLMYSADIQWRAGWEGVTDGFLSHQADTGLCKPWQGAGVLTLHVGDTVTLGDTLTPCPRLLRHHDLASNPSGSVQHEGFGNASSTGGCPVLQHPLSKCLQHPQLLWAPGHPTGPWAPQAQGLSSLPHPGACGVLQPGLSWHSRGWAGPAVSAHGQAEPLLGSVRPVRAVLDPVRAVLASPAWDSNHSKQSLGFGVGCFTSGLC